MNQLKQHATIIVENDRRSLKSRSASDFVYQLTQTVKFTKRSQKKQYYVRLENIRIPISFYNINENNNTFGWTSQNANDNGTQAYTFDLTTGNHSIDDLVSEVETMMNTTDLGDNVYDITYDEPTQIITISRTVLGGDHQVDTLVGSGWKLLGFNLSEEITDGGSNPKDMDGTNVAYTNTMRHLKLQIPNLVSNNVYSNDASLQTHVQPIGVIVPITEIRNDFQFYSNHQGPLIKLSNQTCISDICVKLLDADNNTVDLNGVPFGFSIVFYEYNK